MKSWRRHAWWMVLLLLVAAGFVRLRFDAEILDLLPAGEPSVRGLKLYQEYFANGRELLISLRAPDSDKAEELAGIVAARLRRETNLIADVAWQPPWMEHPEQAAEIVACLWLNQPPEVFGALTNRLAPGNLKAALDDTREVLATSLSPMELARRSFDPYDLMMPPALTNFSGLSAEQGQAAFTSADGTFRVLYVQARTGLENYRECSEWLKSVRAAVESVRASGGEWAGVTVRYTGRPVFVSEIAAGMQRDLTRSVAGTALIIALLFWLTHRRWLPMLWLLALLALILGATIGLGGLLLGSISVVSMGFAAVLLGLAVDYAVVHYQEALAHPRLSVPEIRRAIAPSILWAAITTISAFMVLNLGGLPGLAQLGSLVGIGVALAAVVMVLLYLPPLFRDRREPPPGYVRPPWRTFLMPPLQTSAAPAAGMALTRIFPGSWVARATRPSRSATRRPEPEVAECRRDITLLTKAAFELPPGQWPGGTGGSPVLPTEDGHGYEISGLKVTVLVVVLAGAVLLVQRPHLDRTANALRLQSAEAETALAEITAGLGLPKEPLWVVVSGTNESAVYERLAKAATMLDEAQSNQVISGSLLPTALWPQPGRQAANRATARLLGMQGPLLRETAARAGFATNALFLTDELVRAWARAGESAGVFWPTNDMSRWIVKQFAARSSNEWYAMGLAYPPTNRAAPVALVELSGRMAGEGVYLSGWELLGTATLLRVQERMWLVLPPMVLLVLASLWLAFRRAAEVLLGLAVLLLSGLCLLAVMALAGWSWNLLNLLALPLMLGTGVDYGIFMQLALRRHGGDARVARQSIGRALLLCGGTAVAGFGSLGLSGNAGMASLGRVCAVGIGANMLIAVYLLPGWWVRATAGLNTRSSMPALSNPQSAIRNPQSWTVPGGTPATAGGTPALPNPQSAIRNPQCSTAAPSSFYRVWLWKLGLVIVRILPASLFNRMCLCVAAIYHRLNRGRREVVVQNLLPALQGDRKAAEQTAREVFRQMALKVADLWRFESAPFRPSWLNEQKDWDRIEAVRARGQGMLLITPHLGNWELGGPLLARHGYKLLVLTQPEPGGLTELRKAARAKWGIETLVVGNGGFAFVEIIKRLQAGEMVALLMDRPPPSSAVEAELFGRPFLASIAAAELARASGCALLGVTIVRAGGGYTARVLPEITYDRGALGSREARQELTRKIVRAFEPEIRQHLDQWFHFVPIWPPHDGAPRPGPADV
jgi:lauroyl/myristoyl acyltransferase/predicted exporter